MTTPPPPPPPGYPSAAPAEHPRGTLILVLGILSLLCCGPLGIAALIMGNKALEESKASPVPFTNEGLIKAGRILGIIAIALWVLWIILYATGILALPEFS